MPAKVNRRGIAQQLLVQCGCICGCTDRTTRSKCQYCGINTCVPCEAKNKHRCCPKMVLGFWPGFMNDDITNLLIACKSIPLPKSDKPRTGVARLIDAFALKYNTTATRVLTEMTRLYPEGVNP